MIKSMKWAIVFFLILIAIYFIKYKYINPIHEQIKIYKAKNDSLVALQETRKLMAYTLVVAYNLSFIEAYYYSEIFHDFALTYNSDWEIYAAMVNYESGFKVTLKNPKSGAAGIFQFMEGTIEEQCIKMGVRYRKNETVWREIPSLVLGCNYISTALEKGQEFAIKKYVGGPKYSDTCQYTQQYYDDVKREYEKLKYIYKGIRFDRNNGIDIPDISYYLKSRIPIIRGGYAGL